MADVWPCLLLTNGNLTSQLWANFYLDRLDHKIVEEQRHGTYIRHTDDFLLFGDDKKRLWDLRAFIVEELVGLRLVLSEMKSRLLSCKEGVPFCGFLSRQGLRPRVLGATKRRFERRRNRLIRKAVELDAVSKLVFAWYQFSLEGNTTGLRRTYARGSKKHGQIDA